MSRLLVFAFAATALLGASACSSMDDGMQPADSTASSMAMSGEKTVMVGGAAMFPSKNIVENAVNSKDHTILVAAVTAADLVPTLSSVGPFTVFAPTNAAFAKLPAGTVDTLLKPENKAKLAAILTYHVVAGKVMAKDIKAGDVKSVQGGMLAIALPDNHITINNAKVVKADIETSNGVIHSIDTVLMPS